MQKLSSEKNRRFKAVALAMALLLCLGGFFVFFKGTGGSSQSTADIDTSSRALFIKGSGHSLSEPSVSAKSAVLIEAGSGEVIFLKNADIRMSMASTTKIMTALVALENADISKLVSVSPLAVGVEGSSVYLYPNERLTLEDLLYALLLESANDAAAAIAIEVGGSIEGFAELMNKKALELGLVDTHFDNPHGLDSETHYTTARELALIAREAMANEQFKTIASTYKRTIPLNETEGVRLLLNHNRLLKSYEGAIGVKTGFTKKSGRCLVSAAERGGLTFIAVTLGAPDDWRDHTEMLDFGFSLYEARVLCTPGSFSYIMPISGGDCDHIILENTQELTLILPRGVGEVECTVELPRFVFAPVSEGDVLGRLVFYLDGEEIAESKIVAKGSVLRQKTKKNIFEGLFD